MALDEGPSWAEVSRLAQFVEERLRQLVERATDFADQRDAARIERLLRQHGTLADLAYPYVDRPDIVGAGPRLAAEDLARRRRAFGVLVVMADEFRSDPEWQSGWVSGR